MSTGPIRILSDLHYGDRASRIRTLGALRPLFDGVGRLVLNGDTIDTRTSRNPAFTAALREETAAFFRQSAPATTFLTGNHDPDISDQHTLDLAEGRVFVTHGDILFDDLVPWGKDAASVRKKISAALEALPEAERGQLDPRLGAYRRVAASIPQRHQSERNRLKYAVGFLSDTVWPPTRIFRVLGAWNRAPGLAADLARQHRPQAGFVVIGHIHRPGSWRLPNGIVVLNTGSFGLPLGGWAVDVHPDRLVMREFARRNGEFRLGAQKAEFRLER